MKENFHDRIYSELNEKMLSIEVTSHCNCTCLQCFVRIGTPNPTNLPFDLTKMIITEGLDTGYRHLHITGGEPLLWDGLLEVLDFAFDIGYQTIFLNTNGILLTKTICRSLAIYDDLSISVSLDGPKMIHDSLRGEGSYSLAVKGIRNALDAGIDLFIFTITTQILLPNLHYFADEIYKQFPDIKQLILIQPINPRDEIIPYALNPYEADDFLQLVRTVALLNLYGIKTKVLYEPLVNVVSKLIFMPWIPQARPIYSKGSIFVRANRKISLSHSSKDNFGKYRTGMISKVLASEKYRNAVAPDELTCPECKYADPCRENGLVRPSGGQWNMHNKAPSCKRVLDSIVS